jgi:hypothetical protein
MRAPRRSRCPAQIQIFPDLKMRPAQPSGTYFPRRPFIKTLATDASPSTHACLRLNNHGRRHTAWSHAKIRYLCLQSGTPQTHTTGSGHRSSRLAYLTLYFTPSPPEESRLSRQCFAKVYIVPYSPCVSQRKPHSDNAVLRRNPTQALKMPGMDSDLGVRVGPTEDELIPKAP